MTQEDGKHLDLLAMFHYIVGGITAFFACFPLLHVAMGVAILSGKFSDNSQGSAPPEFVGWMFVIMGSVFILFGWALALVMILTGRKLHQRKHRTFCMVVAGVECIFMPFGTILGVFTLVKLNEQKVKDLFQENAPEAVKEPEA
jgi:hypothetical protein